jgi:hypothetical protein
MSIHSLNTRIRSVERFSLNNDRKVVFCSTAEAEGELVAGYYPFSYGSGSVSDSPFGLPIFFNFKVIGYAMSSKSTNEILSAITFEIQHLKTDSLTPTIIDTFTLDRTYYNKKLNSSVFGAGEICIKVKSCVGLTDDFAKYRIAIYLQSDEIF